MQRQWLPCGKRLHLQHGPIDLIIGAEGEKDAVSCAYQHAYESLQNVLSLLVGELVELREVVTSNSIAPQGCVAQRMHRAARKCMDVDKPTSMIAVAGSVADHVLSAMLKAAPLTRVYVNNGGDIALWLSPKASFTIGICENTETAQIGSNLTLQELHGVGGVATSGWRGRSHSLGIADAVTVLAACAADADAAATVIANAVDVPNCPHVERTMACELSPDSDLGDQLVTTAVGALAQEDINTALKAGGFKAQQLLSLGMIKAAYMALAGRTVLMGDVDALSVELSATPAAALTADVS